MQWNLNGFYNNLEELQLLIQLKTPSIICIQETRFSPKNNPQYKNYTIYRKDNTEGIIASGGTATLIRNESFQSQTRLSTISSLQHVTVQVQQNKMSKLPITVCNIYIPPDSNPTYEELVELSQQLPKPYIIVGDLNAHHQWWGCYDINNRGKIVEYS